jgi:hypothetical protein
MVGITSAAVVGAVVPNGINQLVLMGVAAIIGLLVIFALVQAGLSIFYARALNNQVSQGINALVGVNNMTAIDRAMEDRKQAPAQVQQNNRDDAADDKEA